LAISLASNSSSSSSNVDTVTDDVFPRSSRFIFLITFLGSDPNTWLYIFDASFASVDKAPSKINVIGLVWVCW
jgi:hypothetical protein